MKEIKLNPSLDNVTLLKPKETVIQDLYSQWVDAFEWAGIKPLGDETCCKLLTIIYVYGGSMEFTYNKKLMRDARYAQKRANLYGGETPDAEMIKRIQELTDKLAGELESAPSDKNGRLIHPQWVTDFMSERYGIEEMRL